MSLTPAGSRWVAHLARLELTEAELAAMTRQLGSILDYVDQLQQLNTDGVEPLAHALAVHNVFRDDEPAPSLPVAEALANAPDRRTPRRGRAILRRPRRAGIECAMIERTASELLAALFQGRDHRRGPDRPVPPSHPPARAAGPRLPARR